MEIGLSDLGLSLDPFPLYNGITLAVFKSAGIQPVLKNLCHAFIYTHRVQLRV